MNVKNNFLSIARLLLVLAFAVPFSTAQAQDDDGEKRSKVSGGYGYFSPGGTMLDTDAMNSYLGSYGLGEYNGTRLTLGGGGMMVVRNFVLGGEGHSLLKKDLSNTTQNLNLQGGWGQFYLGYVLLGKKGILLYPKAGIGGYNHRMIVQNAANLPSVDDVFTSGTYPGSELIKTGMLLSGSLNFEFMPGFDETAGSGLVFGLEVGYNYAATDNAWTAYDVNLSGGPSLNMTGAFARLRIGFGGWHRQ